MDEANKCKHESCSCTVEKGKNYCSQICEDSKNVTEIACECGHAGCAGEALIG